MHEEITGVAEAWVEGWVVSRGAAPPVPEPGGGFRVDVGLEHHVTRYVLPRPEEALVRGISRKRAAPGVWIKTFAPPETLAPWLPPGWSFDDPGFLMSAALRRTPAGDAPEGYRLRVWTRGGVTRALVHAPDGSFAARGQIAAPAPTSSRPAAFVVDQVETSARHRRLGLGALVMRTLANTAVEAGATTGVLGATVDGRALYESLGWRVHAPLTGLVFGRPAATAPVPGGTAASRV
ncbi:GNAT family N-acetyltransferase [Streptomyces sp. NPDC048845]|uniref:GNAT family N-acetyltransferase n=1 Tax=Streptomyces sp. NPDC048845 TaxID=3155390 RepID=UPI0034374078